MIEEARKSIAREEFDYQALLDALKGYKRPRDAITRLLRSGAIVRVKKGLYVFGEAWARRPFSREVLANLIYGPSYVSLESALHYYGLIPERVEAVTSATFVRGKRFPTLVGLFIYTRVPQNAYPVAVDRVELTIDTACLMATPEKALADKVGSERGSGLRFLGQMEEYLLNNLRVDEEDLAALSPDRMDAIAQAYGSLRVDLLAGVVRRHGRRRAVA